MKVLVVDGFGRHEHGRRAWQNFESAVRAAIAARRAAGVGALARDGDDDASARLDVVNPDAVAVWLATAPEVRACSRNVLGAFPECSHLGRRRRVWLATAPRTRSCSACAGGTSTTPPPRCSTPP